MFSFLKKKNQDGSLKLPSPTGIPDPVGQSLVVQFKEDPNWAWSLKAVVKPKEKTGQFDISVFSDRMAGAAKVSIKDYSSLNEYPDLILYDWVYDKKYGKVQP